MLKMEYPELYDKLQAFIESERGKGEFGNSLLGRSYYERDIIGTLYYDLVASDDENIPHVEALPHVRDWQDWYWDQIDYLEQWDLDQDAQETWEIYDGPDGDLSVGSGYGDGDPDPLGVGSD